MVNIKPEKIIEIIMNELRNDDEPWNKKGSNLLNEYDNASQSEQVVYNELFVTLCGYSFETLLEMAEWESENCYFCDTKIAVTVKYDKPICSTCNNIEFGFIHRPKEFDNEDKGLLLKQMIKLYNSALNR